VHCGLLSGVTIVFEWAINQSINRSISRPIWRAAVDFAEGINLLQVAVFFVCLNSFNSVCVLLSVYFSTIFDSPVKMSNVIHRVRPYPITTRHTMPTIMAMAISIASKMSSIFHHAKKSSPPLPVPFSCPELLVSYNSPDVLAAMPYCSEQSNETHSEHFVGVPFNASKYFSTS